MPSQQSSNSEGTPKQEKANTDMQIVYDGECPFCSAYVKMVRLKDTVGKVELIDAREQDHPRVKQLLDANFDLDEGMAVFYDDRIHHGADAVNMITLMSTKSHVFKVFFSSKTMSAVLYPVLRFGRNTALFFKGSKKLADHYQK